MTKTSEGRRLCPVVTPAPTGSGPSNRARRPLAPCGCHGHSPHWRWRGLWSPCRLYLAHDGNMIARCPNCMPTGRSVGRTVASVAAMASLPRFPCFAVLPCRTGESDDIFGWLRLPDISSRGRRKGTEGGTDQPFTMHVNCRLARWRGQRKRDRNAV